MHAILPPRRVGPKSTAGPGLLGRDGLVGDLGSRSYDAEARAGVSEQLPHGRGGRVLVALSQSIGVAVEQRSEIAEILVSRRPHVDFRALGEAIAEPRVVEPATRIV